MKAESPKPVPRKRRSAPKAAGKSRSGTATKKEKSRKHFPIVGIGASAGGLEALDLFLRNVPQASGMAFVIVQHLDPTQKGAMPELLQRTTPMKVMQVTDRTLVRPDCVYVIPPNKDMSLLNGVLHLLDPVAPRGLRLPIDYFFRSLAQDLRESSIGVVLSGMGSDGTLGLRAIKEKAGTIFVQEPGSAKFDGMPRSAIESGMADVVAPAEVLPERILTYLHHVPLISGTNLADADKGHSAFAKIVILMRSQTGHDFSLYKKNTVYRRIERRMGIHRIDKIASYVRFLQENPQELDLLFQELLIGVTSFFRDPAAWEELRTVVIPALVKNCPPGQTLRAWVPGCSTGEEAFTLAILFRESMQQQAPDRQRALQIFATDLDREAIDKARAGIFPNNIAADVSAERLDQFFLETDHGFQIVKSVREMLIFAPQNVVMDPPFTRLDLVICRNLLIYLTPELQKKLLPLFHYSLNPGGFLFLGNAETVGALSDQFATVKGNARLYRRIESGTRPMPVEFPGSFSHLASAPERSLPRPANLQGDAEHLLLRQFGPAAVLANEKGDIVYINGRTGKFLEPAAGKANWNLFAMARDGLRYGLMDAFRQVLRKKGPVTSQNLTVRSNGIVNTFDLTVQSIEEPSSLRGLVLTVFTERATPLEAKQNHKSPRASRTRVDSLQRELERIGHEAQIARDEMQSSQEELKSANEEMQSTNEELQSTNEELTTSKEEMQSMNEELQTLNHELMAKVSDLSRANNDLTNLLETTEIATIFLDSALRVRLFTKGSNRVFKLIPGDVGRPITDIASELDYPGLAEDAHEVLRSLALSEHTATTPDGCWFLVRIMPYRTTDNMIDGVVITFLDVTASRSREEGLLDTQVALEKHIDEQDIKLDAAAGSRAMHHERNAGTADAGNTSMTKRVRKSRT